MEKEQIAIIGIPDGWSSLKLASVFQAFGFDARVFSPDSITTEITSPLSVGLDGENVKHFKAVVVKKLGESTDQLIKERIFGLKAIESVGVRVFSPAHSIAKAIDRLTMTLELSKSGIPVPRTLVCEKPKDVLVFLEQLGSIVIKPLFTSKARGMVKIDLESKDANEGYLASWKKEYGPFFYAQEFIRATSGKDVGLMFLGNNFIGAYARVAQKGEWKTTTVTGGYYEPYEPTKEMIDLGMRAANIFGLSYTGVDVVEGQRGYLVYEVSAFGGFRGLLEACSIDAARAYAEYVLAYIGKSEKRAR